MPKQNLIGEIYFLRKKLFGTAPLILLWINFERFLEESEKKKLSGLCFTESNSLPSFAIDFDNGKVNSNMKIRNDPCSYLSLKYPH